MAIKIRCVECRKKISIDEAFAGGVCRCPYCTAIVYVPDEGKTAARQTRRPESPSARPEAPVAEKPAAAKVGTLAALESMSGTQAASIAEASTVSGEDTAVEAVPEAAPVPDVPGKREPETPTEVDKALAVAHGQSHIPIAAPVKVQGIIAIILSALLVCMVGGMVYLGIYVTTPRVVEDIPEGYKEHAFTTRTDYPAVAGDIKVETPVVYCIDTSQTMAETLDYGYRMVIMSLKSLKGGKFNVILLGEDDDKTLSDKPIAADEAGIKKAREFMTPELTVAAELERGLRSAVAMGAKTVVLMAQQSEPGLKAVAEGPFKEKSIVLHTIVLGANSKGLEEIAVITGGKSRSYTISELEAQSKRKE